MRHVQSTVLAGSLIGLVLGLSSGVAFGGDAYNGAFIFTPIGAVIGWLATRGNPATSAFVEPNAKPEAEPRPGISPMEKIVRSILVLLATLWNAHIALLSSLSILPVFIQKPWLFIVLAILVALVFPPFLGLYFFAYIAATHFGASEQTSYRASV